MIHNNNLNSKDRKTTIDKDFTIGSGVTFRWPDGLVKETAPESAPVCVMGSYDP